MEIASMANRIADKANAAMRASAVDFRVPGPRGRRTRCITRVQARGGEEKELQRPSPYAERERESSSETSLSLLEAGMDAENLMRMSKDPPGHKSGYVAIVGKPNAGKSTLLNHLVGSKVAIVTRKPQTTRHRILGILSEDDYQLVLVDTPGVIHVKHNQLENVMMSNVKRAMGEADAIVAVVDVASRSPFNGLSSVCMPDGRHLSESGLPLAIVLNKLDKKLNVDLGQLETHYQEEFKPSKIFRTCAHTGKGVQEVKEWAVEQIPVGPSLYPKDLVSEHPERFFVAEIVREKVFLNYRNEIPYSIQVNIPEFHERAQGKEFILAEIIVERESQKGIVIGAKGAALKKLAMSARLDIEDFLGKPVYLEVKVKVKPDWRENADLLDTYGFKNWIGHS